MLPPSYVHAVSTARTALVTGANQGLGFALAHGLATRLSEADRVLLTGRDLQRVRAAAQRIAVPVARVEARVLDVREPGAIERLADELGAVDIVYSNATTRWTPDDDSARVVDAVYETSNVATSRILRAFAPILRPGGRLLVVASSLGRLGNLPSATRSRFPDDATLADVDAVLADWVRAVHAGTAEDEGWPAWLNIPSKVGQVAAVRAVARERRERDLPAGRLIAAVCPGLIDTDASRPWFADMSRAQTPEQAAEALLELALSTELDPADYGELVRFGEVLDWGDSTSSSRSSAKNARA
jgi:NAD(P)-dependent dehydrogenase (short-subunit alcohol dehydrogenase family)